jgi:hypothetical protein
LRPDAVLGVGAIEDGDGVTIGDFDDLAGEGVGEGSGRCQQQECSYDHMAHVGPL